METTSPTKGRTIGGYSVWAWGALAVWLSIVAWGITHAPPPTVDKNGNPPLNHRFGGME